jgi:FkbM family methyltransferase
MKSPSVYIRRFFGDQGYDIHRSGFRWTRPIDVLDLAIKSCLHPDFFFIQIGANDGVYADPIRSYVVQHRWRGILVEPSQEMFQRLVKNYEGYPLQFENKAITDKSGQKVVMRKHPQDQGQISLMHNSNGESETVETITLYDLYRDRQVSGVDLLQVDAEGYDAKIVGQALNMGKHFRPKIIHFEAGSIPRSDYLELSRMLGHCGYRTFPGSGGVNNDHVSLLSDP